MSALGRLFISCIIHQCPLLTDLRTTFLLIIVNMKQQCSKKAVAQPDIWSPGRLGARLFRALLIVVKLWQCFVYNHKLESHVVYNNDVSNVVQLKLTKPSCTIAHQKAILYDHTLESHVVRSKVRKPSCTITNQKSQVVRLQIRKPSCTITHQKAILYDHYL